MNHSNWFCEQVQPIYCKNPSQMNDSFVELRFSGCLFWNITFDVYNVYSMTLDDFEHETSSMGKLYDTFLMLLHPF